MIKGTLSEIYSLTYGLPPNQVMRVMWYFLGYFCSLFDIIELYSPSVGANANDTQLYLGFDPSSVEERIQAVKAIENYI